MAQDCKIAPDNHGEEDKKHIMQDFFGTDGSIGTKPKY